MLVSMTPITTDSFFLFFRNPLAFSKLIPAIESFSKSALNQFSNSFWNPNGLKIVQISDLHLGSFVNDFEEIEKAIDLINEQEADLLFFTGDMVNVHSDEAEPWIEIFSKLKAKKGKYSIFGNHDYADYGPYSKEEKTQSINRLKEIHNVR